MAPILPAHTNAAPTVDGVCLLHAQTTEIESADRRGAAAGHQGGHVEIPDPRAILNSIGEVVYDWDFAADTLRWGANICEVLGVADARSIATGIGFAGHLAPESPGTRYEAAMAACERDLGAGGSYQVQYGLVLPERIGRGDPGGRVWIEDTGRVFCGPDRRPIRAHGIIRVITERFEAERRQVFRSVFDPQTGALNRANITDQISRLFAQGGVSPPPFAVLMVSLRGLADVNHRHSYDVADEIIAGAAQRLRAHMRTTDSIGRYSGNKFAVLLESCTDEQMSIAAQRLLAAIESEPFATQAGPVAMAAHVGCALAPRHARQAQPLLQRAEEALDLARAGNLRQPSIYQPDLARDDARRRSLRIADDVIAALNERRIALALQPVVAAESRQPVFHEALFRMCGADGGLTEPGDILPMAEHSGLIAHLDHRILELALALLSSDPKLRLAVNASGATLRDPEWPLHLAAALRLSPGAAERLLIEVNETCVAQDIEGTRAAVAAMKPLGVRVALDHFGAGHLSLRSLRDLGFDLLKIDGAFMQKLDTSVDDRFFVRSLIGIARHLGVPTVAEWVESAAAADILDQWGVDFMQGYHFGAAQMLAPSQRGGDAARVA